VRTGPRTSMQFAFQAGSGGGGGGGGEGEGEEVQSGIGGQEQVAAAVVLALLTRASV